MTTTTRAGRERKQQSNTNNSSSQTGRKSKHHVVTSSHKSTRPQQQRQQNVDIEKGRSFAIAEISIPDREESTRRKHHQPIKQRQHFSWLAYGRFLTPLAIATAISGFTMSFLSMRSYAFVQLTDPIKLPNIRNVSTMGLLWMQVCFDDEAADDDDAGQQQEGFQTADVIATLNTGHRGMENINREESSVDDHRHLLIDEEMILGGCHKIRLTQDMVNDRRWSTARSFLALAIAFGGFLTIMLTTCIYWESINLKPISFGLLLTYFFQTLSFFFFDSEMCRTRGCSLAEGSIMGIVGGVMWFVSAMVSIRMDSLYRLKQKRIARQQRREERRRRKAAADEAATTRSMRKMLHQQTTASTSQESTDSCCPALDTTTSEESTDELNISDTNMTPPTAGDSSDSDEFPGPDDDSYESEPSNYFETTSWI